MVGETVLNYFRNPVDGKVENDLVLDGTAVTGDGQSVKTVLVTLNISSFVVADTLYLAPGIAGKIVRISGLSDNSFGESGETLTVSFNINEIAIPDSSISIAEEDIVAGDIIFSTPTEANELQVGDYIKIVNSGLGLSPSLQFFRLTFQIELD